MSRLALAAELTADRLRQFLRWAATVRASDPAHQNKLDRRVAEVQDRLKQMEQDQ